MVIAVGKGYWWRVIGWCSMTRSDLVSTGSALRVAQSTARPQTGRSRHPYCTVGCRGGDHCRFADHCRFENLLHQPAMHETQVEVVVVDEVLGDGYCEGSCP